MIADPPSGVAEYQYVSLPRQGRSKEFYNYSLPKISDLLVRLANGEGPLHLKAACRRVAACWGISRVGNFVEYQIRLAANELAGKGQVRIVDDFLWPKEMTEVIVRRPAPGEQPRSIEEIAVEEIAQAAYLCLEDAYSLSKEDLVVAVAHLLGYDRTGMKVRDRVILGIDMLIRDNRARVANEKVEIYKP